MFSLAPTIESSEMIAANVFCIGMHENHVGPGLDVTMRSTQRLGLAKTSDECFCSDFGGNAIHRFDATTETFATFALPSSPGDVRQLLGRPGEV